MPSGITLIAGLGNPGPDYEATRHNAGFWFVDSLADHFSVRFSSEKKLFSEIARVQADGNDCRLLKPVTFMNESGRAVKSVTEYFSIEVSQILVVHDEIDLDAGVVRLKQGGGHGGHNGLRDINQQLGDNNYYRLRIGVSHPGSKERVTPHVLGRPGSGDRGLIDTAIERALAVMPLVLKGEMQKAMTELHTETGE